MGEGNECGVMVHDRILPQRSDTTPVVVEATTALPDQTTDPHTLPGTEQEQWARSLPGALGTVR
ncbi:hypothetical protein KRMM14A1004_49160 [Krasilnikovia sp. MM14-A1004]